ncbi:PREDICTED: iron-sulfur cluster assembly protein 2-like [Camelina sativa]|uniref:Iron-sulfur cluster assembly protein 2-like n=1 Tax=Camelina sativa TaxID=90675 RepID=A0ABM0ZDW9_CAMSA|nr:PREDICTED: iron-sulfur cluster assembly protein 2-like [Camelina sativa]
MMMMLRQTAKKAFLGLRSPTACPLGGGGVGRRLYHENVIDHFENPRNVGSFNRDDPDVGTGLVGSPSYGDLMSLFFRRFRMDQWQNDRGCFDYQERANR